MGQLTLLGEVTGTHPAGWGPEMMVRKKEAERRAGPAEPIRTPPGTDPAADNCLGRPPNPLLPSRPYPPALAALLAAPLASDGRPVRNAPEKPGR